MYKTFIHIIVCNNRIAHKGMFELTTRQSPAKYTHGELLLRRQLTLVYVI